MSRLIETGNKFRNFSVYVICVFMLFIMGFLTVQSFLFTTDVLPGIPQIEIVTYAKDNAAVNIIAALLGTCAVFVLAKAVGRVSVRFVRLILFLWFIVIGFWWVMTVYTGPFFDSYHVTCIAENFSENNYILPDDEASYLNMYPFQSGFIAFCQIIISVLNLAYFQPINVIMFAFAMCLIVRIVCLSANEKAGKIAAILCMTALQPILFCTFIYGNIPSFTFACAAVYFMLLFMKDCKWYFGLVSAVCIGLSVCLKENSYIILAAMIIIIWFDFFKNRRELLKKAAYIVICVILSVGILKGVMVFYDSKTSVDLRSGIPMACWLATGLGDGSPREIGWFDNACSADLYVANDRDSAKTSAAAIEIVKDEFRGFMENPSAAVRFFYRKTVSQWNDPTYQSVWLNTLIEPYTERVSIGKYITGEGESYAKAYMNYYQQLIFLFSFIGIYFCLKNKNQKLSIFALIILGGFLYHFFFEAKSQYSLTYFVLMLPLAAYGFENVFTFAGGKIHGIKHKSRLVPQSKITV